MVSEGKNTPLDGITLRGRVAATLGRTDAWCIGTRRRGLARRAILALQDGSWYEGESFGAEVDSFGEVVFNTSMTGYQEILTDPSYAGQIVIPTYPIIGNYGVNGEHMESREHSALPASPCASTAWTPATTCPTMTIHEYLASQGICRHMRRIDTRAVTRKAADSRE